MLTLFLVTADKSLELVILLCCTFTFILVPLQRPHDVSERVKNRVIVIEFDMEHTYKMRLPGFAAESSLYEKNETQQLIAGYSRPSDGRLLPYVIPADVACPMWDVLRCYEDDHGKRQCVCVDPHIPSPFSICDALGRHRVA
jgi:hypothetical protein